MNKSNSGHKLSEMDQKRTSGFEDNEKSGRPIRLKDFGHMTDNNNDKNKKNQRMIKDGTFKSSLNNQTK